MVIDFRIGAPIPPDLRARQVHQTLYGQAYGRISSGQQAEIPADGKGLLELMDRHGITHAVIPVEDNETTLGSRTGPEALAAFCAADPERLIGFCGADPYKGMKAVRELEHAVRDLGVRGLNIGQFWQELTPDDRRYYPLYAKCVELGVPVILHAAMNLSLEVPIEYSHPRYIDRVATDFPELTIIATHGGWPWVLEMVAVAWRRPNVYIDTAAQRPKYLGMESSGWAPFVHFGNTLLQDRILFASRWPLLPFGQTIAEIKELPLKPEVQEKWLWRNAATLLGLRI
ncbi:MAG: amidohydrolase [Dehalococcoidia bacterium]|nr:MAG: amidohydrolase [Dehalococcoidia bacterium]